jgi:hypothetical protein
MRLPVVYIAGAYRAPTPRRILANIWRAQDAALEVWQAGAVALCPHGNTALFDGEADDEVWLQGDFELLRRCDALYLVAGWERSAGAQGEYSLAAELGLPIFRPAERERLVQWIAQWRPV